MTLSRSVRRRAAWSAPVLTAAVVGGAALLPSTASASAHPRLPALSAAQLLAAVQTSDVTALSGTVVETARLGLPSLPGVDNAAALTWQTFVTGTHTARVWLDGPDKQRVALLGQLAESDVVHNGNDLWSFASDTQQVGHTVLATHAPDKATEAPDKKATAPDLKTYTPQGAADQALQAISPSTLVTVDRTARVAGRPAYTLVLTPRDSRTTVHRVLIAIDATHEVPLRVQVFGAGVRPAFETAFTEISFQRPAASVFAFTPPKGAVVSKDLLPLLSATHVRAGDTSTRTPDRAPTVVGSGWTSVLVLPASASGTSPLAGLGANADAKRNGGSVLDHLTSTLPNGDRVIRSALVNALLTRDGRVLVGAVSTSVLEQVAAGHLT